MDGLLDSTTTDEVLLAAKAVNLKGLVQLISFRVCSTPL